MYTFYPRTLCLKVSGFVGHHAPSGHPKSVPLLLVKIWTGVFTICGYLVKSLLLKTCHIDAKFGSGTYIKNA